MRLEVEDGLRFGVKGGQGRRRGHVADIKNCKVKGGS
jgi:hypothetical protein